MRWQWIYDHQSLLFSQISPFGWQDCWLLNGGEIGSWVVFLTCHSSRRLRAWRWSSFLKVLKIWIPLLAWHIRISWWSLKKCSGSMGWTMTSGWKDAIKTSPLAIHWEHWTDWWNQVFIHQILDGSTCLPCLSSFSLRLRFSVWGMYARGSGMGKTPSGLTELSHERCRFGRRESSGPRNRERKNEMSWQCRSKNSWIIVVSCWCLELCRSYLKKWWNMMKKVY